MAAICFIRQKQIYVDKMEYYCISGQICQTKTAISFERLPFRRWQFQFRCYCWAKKALCETE